MKEKVVKPGVVSRYVRLFGAANVVVAEEAKKDLMMKGYVKNFRALYAGGGAKEMAEARERALGVR